MVGERILVVDDDVNVAKMCIKALRGAGFEAERASDGTEAIACCQKETFDLLLIDLKMPGLGGLEVLRTIKELDPDIAAIIITAYGTLESAVEAMRLGAQEYLNKPFDGDQLVTAVQQVLAKKLQADGVVRGNLREMSLTSIVSINCNERNQARLRIRHRGTEAALFFEDGQIVHMVLDSQEGEDVIYRLLSWEEGAFELKRGVPPPKRTVTADWSGLILEGLHRIDESAADRTRGEAEGRVGRPILALSGEIFEHISHRLDRLLAEVEGRCVLMADRGGRLVHWQGRIDKSQAISLAALVAGSFSATAEIAGVLRNEGETRQFRQSLQESEDFSIYSVAVGDRLILSVSFNNNIPLGLVRFYTLEAAGEMQEVLAEEATSPLSLDEGLRHQVGDALDALFGD